MCSAPQAAGSRVHKQRWSSAAPSRAPKPFASSATRPPSHETTVVGAQELSHHPEREELSRGEIMQGGPAAIGRGATPDGQCLVRHPHRGFVIHASRTSCPDVNALPAHPLGRKFNRAKHARTDDKRRPFVPRPCLCNYGGKRRIPPIYACTAILHHPEGHNHLRESHLSFLRKTQKEAADLCLHFGRSRSAPF